MAASTPVQPWPTGDASVLAPVQEHEDLRKVMRDLEGKAGPPK